MCLGEKLEREEREREREFAQNTAQNSFFFFFWVQNEGFGGFYSEKVNL